MNIRNFIKIILAGRPRGLKLLTLLGFVLLLGIFIVRNFVYSGDFTQIVFDLQESMQEELVSSSSPGDKLKTLQRLLLWVKRELIKEPKNRVPLDRATFSWGDLIFKPAYQLFKFGIKNCDLEQLMPMIIKILRQVDGICDEFCDEQGDFFDADLACLAEVWRNKMHRLIARAGVERKKDAYKDTLKNHDMTMVLPKPENIKPVARIGQEAGKQGVLNTKLSNPEASPVSRELEDNQEISRNSPRSSHGYSSESTQEFSGLDDWDSDIFDDFMTQLSAFDNPGDPELEPVDAKNLTNPEQDKQKDLANPVVDNQNNRGLVYVGDQDKKSSGPGMSAPDEKQVLIDDQARDSSGLDLEDYFDDTSHKNNLQKTVKTDDSLSQEAQEKVKEQIQARAAKDNARLQRATDKIDEEARKKLLGL